MTDDTNAFLLGHRLPFAQADALWQAQRRNNDLSRARQVLDRLHQPDSLIDGLPRARAERERLVRNRAMLTSKDPELGAGFRHDRALLILAELFDLDDAAHNGQPELLGIAAGIHKRRWQDLGQLQDLQAAARYYERGAGPDLGSDAYAHINAAFLDDLLADLGDDPAHRQQRAAALRQRIVDSLPARQDWFNIASRAEALFGLRRFAEAAALLRTAKQRPEPWELQTTARQLGELVRICQPTPAEMAAVRDCFEALWPGGGQVAGALALGKLGLALSGGGFRAAFYHLGLLARLAEHNLLRHVDVLSCVSGGSIVGAFYWLLLRQRLRQPKAMQHADYLVLMQQVIQRFSAAVDGDLRGQAQPTVFQALVRVARGERGLIDPDAVAKLLDERFYQPLMPELGGATIMMHDLVFAPADHAGTGATAASAADFNPGRDNWLRAHKVPALVLNATTVNTGHAWQFTPTWMGESPWAVHEQADSVPRLEWAWYAPAAGWQIGLGRAVAASASVPGLFSPLPLGGQYSGDVQVQLVDGGVFDNQGTASLLAMNCNLLLVSDACGQLLFEKAPAPGPVDQARYALRSMDTLMERVRGASQADLAARRQSGQLRGLMLLHMKAGLAADTIPRKNSQQTQQLQRSAIAPSGLRCDFQQALAELRTDLDRFSAAEKSALMACGYQMAGQAIARDLPTLAAWAGARQTAPWPFLAMLAEITSTADATPDRASLLQAFRDGSRVRLV